MAANNDVDLYITLHATFRGDYLPQPLRQLVDVPPDPGPPRANTAVLPVETGFNGTRVHINEHTYLQINTTGNVVLNRVDNHITVNPSDFIRPAIAVDNMRDQVYQWPEQWMPLNPVQRENHNNGILSEYGRGYLASPQHPQFLYPPTIEMRNMTINRRPNEHDREYEQQERR
uniref:Pepsin-I3 domain-containing protein n=1 Tax=Caenorhabditis tropicalis TaxID=1561998 RepID=A0A1I7T8X9_9PELO